MYAIHTTPGFIIDSRPRGEAGKLLSIFTRDFGLVMTSAQGVRLEKSKLRYFTQDCSFGTFSLVRGKEFWRLTSAMGEEIALGRPAQELLARTALLLRRFLQGEEPHPELYACVESCVSFLNANPDLAGNRLSALESLTVLKILHALGYIGSDPAIDKHLSKELTPASLDGVYTDRKAINQAINKALKESHL